MLLKLISAHSEPTIHFSFDFKDLPQNVITPSSWSGQLSHLIVEDLEVPNTVHSLDKAAGITSLLEEVAFDVERGEVRCLFVDGAVEEWGFFRFGAHGGEENGFQAGQKEGRELLAALESIVKDVKASTQEDERVFLEREKERQRLVGLERSKSLSNKTSSGKVSKHKKQRSVFMHFVSSIGSTFANLTSPSASHHTNPHRFHTSLSTPPPTSRSESPSGPSQLPSAGTTPRARALRRAARSALVDTYRRFVLSELTRRLQSFSYLDESGKYIGVHGGGFCVWILHSMRRRAQERIDQLFEEAEMIAAHEKVHSLTPSDSQSDAQSDAQQALECIPDQQMQPQHEQNVKGESGGLDTTTMALPLLGFDEDEIVTETDGSSLRTPSIASHLTYYPARPPTSASFHSQASFDSQTDGQQQLQVASKEPDFQPEFLTNSTLSSPPNSPISPTPPSSPCPESVSLLTPVTSTRPTSASFSHTLTGAALAEYNHLTDLRERLWQLALFSESQTRIAAEEVRNRLEVLAVRSYRRAWCAGAFRGECAAGPNGCKLGTGVSLQTQYGFAMPFRSSPLARYSWTAEDMQNEQEREMELAASASCISVAGFPSYFRPPDLDIDDGSLDGSHLEDEEADDPRPLIEREFELYEEFPGPSPLDLRGGRARRNKRRWNELMELGLNGGVRRLFPVSEELEGEGEEAVDLEFRVALGGAGVAGYGLVRGRRKERKGRTFMGCDEVAVERDEEEEKLGLGQVSDIDDGLVDPRELDIELGFGFDFHQKGDGSGFLGHADGDNLFDQEDDDDEDDEDEFKFDLSAQLERPKIRPRMRTSSIFMPRDVDSQSLKQQPPSHASMGGILCQPVNFASSSLNLPLKSTQSAGSTRPPRAHHVSPHLDISRTVTPTIYCEPDVAEIEIHFGGEYGVPACLPRVSPHPSTSEVDLRKAISGVMKPLPAAPLPMPMPLQLGLDDEDQEEFTLAMDLPRAVGGGGGTTIGSSQGESTGKKWMRQHTLSATLGRSLRLFGDGHGSLVSSFE